MKKLSFENIVRKDVMRRVVLCAFLISHFSFLISPVSAQPKARRQQPKAQQQQQKKQQTQSQGISMRAKLMFPTAIEMPEDVVCPFNVILYLSLSSLNQHLDYRRAASRSRKSVQAPLSSHLTSTFLPFTI